MEDYIEIECENCIGSGLIEVMETCATSIADCCGGCTKQIDCEECDGEGIIYQ
tara:strand:- start:7088 stop:7246 length:159 start_codon:yes stop_codon:yes gene_type:complete